MELTYTVWILVSLLCVVGVLSYDVSDVLFVVLSQPNVYHARRAEAFRKHFGEQAGQLDKKPSLWLLHEQWDSMPGAWTIFPMFTDILTFHGHKSAVFICEEETTVDLLKLAASLDDFDFSEGLFLGRALQDQEPTIIHHFAFHEAGVKTFSYADFAAGFILSMPLVKTLFERLKTGRQGPGADFTIDAKHELALFIWDEGRGVKLMHAEFLCAGDDEMSENCATGFPSKPVKCGDPISDDSVYLAVKTCEKYHKTRVPVIKETWEPDAKHIEYFSEMYDPDIPTVNQGLPNTEKGHCGKLLAILKRASNEPDIMNKDWIVIVDDDTLISLPRLRRLLSCYHSGDPIALGERYGYATARGHGYDYITGGGGIVLSQMAVRILMDLGVSCASDDAPDDMTLGLWLKHLKIPVTHSPLFHQARPADYSSDYLSHQQPISFHKHWNVDPLQVWRQWLAEPRSKVISSQNDDDDYDETHDEL